GISRVQYWKGELAPAHERMGELVRAEPKNADALALLGDICMAQHDVACAHDSYAGAAAIAPSEVLEKKLANAAAPPVARFDVGGQVDRYDSDRNVEGSFFVQGSWNALSSLVLSGGYEQLHQFGQTDHRVNIGGFVHPIDDLLLNIRLAISPSANTVASWELNGGAELHVGGPVTALAGVRHLDFKEGTPAGATVAANGVTIISAGARLDLGDWAITGQGGVVLSTRDSTQGYGAGKVEYAVTDAVRVYAGVAVGGQTQFALPTETALDVAAGVTWQIDR